MGQTKVSQLRIFWRPGQLMTPQKGDSSRQLYFEHIATIKNVAF
jgi:hypothetical protein